MLKILDLKTNHRSEPLGIDGVPYFGWKLCSSKKNVTQQAYQLTVEDVQTKEVVWDSGAVSSSQSSFADYAGAPLHSCTEYRWTVRVWDNHGVPLYGGLEGPVGGKHAGASSRPGLSHRRFLRTGAVPEEFSAAAAARPRQTVFYSIRRVSDQDQ